MLFKNKKKKAEHINEISTTDDSFESQQEKYSTPELCFFDFKKSVSSLIDEAGFKVYEGSLGPIVNVHNEYDSGHYCLLNCDIPKNLHEYDILVFDLNNKNKIEYDPEQHKKSEVSSSDDLYLYCNYPKTLFNPKAYAGTLITKKIAGLKNRDSVIIIFADRRETTEYQIAKNEGRYAKVVNTAKYDNYSFMPNGIRSSNNKNGKSIRINSKLKAFESILKKYSSDMEYHSTFYHPTTWVNGESKEIGSFIPLLFNNDDEIIGYAELDDKQWIFVFPEIEQKGNFLKELFEEVLPSIIPQLFPDHQKALWTEKKDYLLPNEFELNIEKEALIKQHREKLEEIENRIMINHEKYDYLHKILIETGDELVNNVITFLDWLGFTEIKNMDEENPEKKEEDIQIPLDNGLLVIETKGIGGTSKDDECAQISKIRSRRCEERNSFDVFGLYIVNHQRHIPPYERKNPPFTSDQESDAKINKRGLITTWNLFHLFHNIQNGVISKEQARLDLLNIGLIDFNPDGIRELGEISEIYMKGEVIIIKNIQSTINKEKYLFVKNGYIYKKISVHSIQVNGKDIDQISEGEVGIKIDSQLKVGEMVFVSK